VARLAGGKSQTDVSQNVRDPSIAKVFSEESLEQKATSVPNSHLKKGKKAGTNTKDSTVPCAVLEVRLGAEFRFKILLANASILSVNV
jgi:hypothetical protein